MKEQMVFEQIPFKLSFADYLWIVFVGVPRFAVMWIDVMIQGIRHRGWKDTFSFTAP